MSADAHAVDEQELPSMPHVHTKPTPGRDLTKSTNIQVTHAPARRPGAEMAARSKGGCLTRAARYYVEPLVEFPRTMARQVFHVVNFAYMIVVAVVVPTFLFTSIGLIPLACVGLVLLYGSVEVAVGLAWIDVAMAYHLVEDDDECRAAGRPRLGFKRGRLPECCDVRNRAKALATDPRLYSALFYEMVAKPVVTCLTWWVVTLVASDVFALFLWTWWLVDDTYLRKYACIGGETCVDEVCDCHGWALNSAGDVVLVSLIALLLLPVVLRFSNWLAWCSLQASYFFLTTHFDEADDEAALLAPAPARPQDEVVKV